MTAVDKKAIELLSKGKHAIIHTGGAGQQQAVNLPADKLGAALGNIAREAAAKATLKRIVIAGGDTSSYAARAMGIEAVEMIAAARCLARLYVKLPRLVRQ